MKPSVASTEPLATNFEQISFAFSIVVPFLGGTAPNRNTGRELSRSTSDRDSEGELESIISVLVGHQQYSLWIRQW